MFRPYTEGMAMGRKPRARQASLWVEAQRLQGLAHPFYEKLNQILEEAGFDRLAERLCAKYYDPRLGRPSLPPGVYFRCFLIGYFEGLDSERAIAYRVADSLSLRQFLGLSWEDNPPDHSTLSKTRRLFSLGTHRAVFRWVLKLLARKGLLRGRTLGVDATTLEANAAMKSIVRRDTGQSYDEHVARLMASEERPQPTAAQRRRGDRRRQKAVSNREWVNPHGLQARITMKDGRTHLAYKAEQAVDLETGAVVAVTVQEADRGDTESLRQTLGEAGCALTELAGESASEPLGGGGDVSLRAVERVVADKGYHSRASLRELAEMGVRTVVAEPERGRQGWRGQRAEQQAVYANRRRLRSPSGRAWLRKRGELLERTSAHLYNSGGMRRLHLRGRRNIAKRLLLQAAAFNLSLILRCLLGVGTARGAADRLQAALFYFWWLWIAQTTGAWQPADSPQRACGLNHPSATRLRTRCRHGCLSTGC